jgi:uncharacterized RDD family membrane protein YckC
LVIKSPSIAIQRILAFGADWLVILVWAGLIFGVVMAVTAGNPERLSSPWISQTMGFVLMTLPVVLCFAVLESSVQQATLGKRVFGLMVIDQTGQRTSFGSAFFRNAIKFAPWESGHIVANQFAFSDDAEIATWVYGPMVISFIFPLWWIVSIFSTGRTPYDRASCTQVVHTHQVPA